ncbi:pyrimidine-specific ribonucleoside hydrolase RihA [Loigolactobacillus backii]|uniref:pyrimidine-specific ribonucleoside hydrolase RihA n=1 Tax=Loigolactobacillus backii TaxID=375175 RepID=UPI000C1CB3E1|nr:pyrimidine-specific ribonucleoside hydrolase RihA [Loigolactobacillus backii]PIO83161.1 pyrimidine-specific ribonucleoside hydrolase RihA [Loigolactobacillus backii]
MPTKIILDCDPGHDDAIALMLAVASPKIGLLAVTSSAGNQTPAKTLNNVLRLLTLMKQQQVPVAAGNQTPLLQDLQIADDVHGKTGLDGATLPEPDFAPRPLPAVELIAQTLRQSDGPVTLVVTGPMTNAALFLAVHPELKSKIKRIVFMGGAMGMGNWTPTVEFNMFVDPEAAKLVINSGVPLTMAGLNVTHQAQILQKDVETMRQINNPVAQAITGLLDFYRIYYSQPKWGFEGTPVHDPCTIAWLIDPTMFESVYRNVDVETKGDLTRGETLVDYYHLTNKPENTDVLLKINREKFSALIIAALKTFS